jgi:hypothetical protein
MSNLPLVPIFILIMTAELDLGHEYMYISSVQHRYVNAYGNIPGENWKVTKSSEWHFLKQAFNGGAVDGVTYTYLCGH